MIPDLESMELRKCECNCQDIACGNRLIQFTVWQVPYFLLIAGIVAFWFNTEWSGWLWFAGFSWLGVACISNALHCKRKHCFFTGPVYLILGIISLLINLNLLSIHWHYIWILFFLGTLMAYATEWNGRKYF